MQENLLAAMTPPRTLLGSLLTALPQTSQLVGRGLAAPSARTPTPALALIQNRRIGPFQHDGLDPPLCLKGKCSPYSITERRVPELIPVLGSQPAGDVSHKPGGRLTLLSSRPAVTLATLKTAATNFAAWRTEARWV